MKGRKHVLASFMAVVFGFMAGFSVDAAPVSQPVSGKVSNKPVRIGSGPVRLAPKPKESHFYIKAVRVQALGEDGFIFVTFSKPIDNNSSCNEKNVGVVTRRDEILSVLIEAKKDNTPVELELAPQPCQTIGSFNYYMIESINFLDAEDYARDDLGKGSKILHKGSRRKLRIN